MPHELWGMSTRVFVDMYEAHIKVVEEDNDTEMQRTAWFTALLMNASGNIKKRITPDKLYIPVDKRNPESAKKQVDYVEEQRKQLAKKFNIES